MAFILNLEINRKKLYGSIDNQSQFSLNILKRIKTHVTKTLIMLKMFFL